jgi:hypothetical protein
MLLLNESMVLIMRANIESVWNAESDGTPVQLGFAQRNYFSREDHGPSRVLAWEDRGDIL